MADVTNRRIATRPTRQEVSHFVAYVAGGITAIVATTYGMAWGLAAFVGGMAVRIPVERWSSHRGRWLGLAVKSIIDSEPTKTVTVTARRWIIWPDSGPRNVIDIPKDGVSRTVHIDADGRPRVVEVDGVQR